MEDSKALATHMSPTTALDADKEVSMWTRKSTEAWSGHSST
jgi:hypothetical protein